MEINKKDIICVNMEIGCNGQFSNESSMEFALSIIKQKKSWLYELSYIIKSLLVEHVFQDGNKRTAATVIALYLEENGLDYDKEKIIKAILQISRKNISDINKIMRMIKNVIA